MKTRYLQIFCWSALLIAGLGLTSVCWADTSKPQRLSVSQAVQIAMEYNLQRQMAQTDVSVAHDKVSQSKSAYGPKINLGGGYYHYNDQPGLVKLEDGLVNLNNAMASLPSGMIPYQSEPDMGLNYYGLQIGLEQPLYTGNKLTATHKQAQANLAHAEADLGATDNNLILQVKRK